MTHYSLEDVAPEGVRELAHFVRLSIHPTINLQMWLLGITHWNMTYKSYYKGGKGSRREEREDREVEGEWREVKERKEEET